MILTAFDRARQSSLLRSVGIYTAANIFSAALPFSFLPVFTRILTPAEMGLYAIFVTSAASIVPLTSFSSNGAYLSVAHKTDDRGRSNFALGCLIISAVGTIFAALIGTGAIHLGVESIGGLQLTSTNFACLMLAVLLQSLQPVLFAVLQVQDRARTYAVLQICQAAASTALSLLLVNAFARGGSGRIEGQIYAGTLTLLASFFALRGFLARARILRDDIRRIIRFGAPLIPHSLGSILMIMVDRMWVSHFSGNAAMGIYAVAYQLGAIIGILETSFNTAWAPWFIKKLRSGSEFDKKRIVQITYIYFITIFSLALLLTLCLKLFGSRLLGRDFQGSFGFVLWIALAYSFSGMYKMVANYLFYLEKTSQVASVTVTCGVLHIGISYLLTRTYGASGAAVASTITFFLSFIGSWFLAARAFPMPWRSPFRSDRNASSDPNGNGE